VRQDILAVVGNVTYYFVGNLTHTFQQWKNCENRSRFDDIIVTRGWRVFGTECISFCLLEARQYAIK